MTLVGLLAVAALLVLGSGGDPDPPPVAGLVNAGAADPGGEASADVELPPPGKWVGFSGTAFAFTGSGNRAFDVGLTPERTASDALAAGMNAARIVVGWRDLEGRRGVRNPAYVRNLDRFVHSFRRGGGRVLFVMTSTPPWASEDPGDPAAPPSDDPDILSAFGDHVAFVARTWPDALGIETWNEPNAGFAWRDPDPAHYARMHGAAADAIRELDTEVALVVAGLSDVDRPDVIGPQRYLKAMYAAGLTPEDYDALALHPYPGQADGRMAGLGAGTDFARAFADFRAGFRTQDPDAAVWVTEVGLSTTGVAPLSPTAQASGLVRLTRKILSMPDVDALFLHTQYDATGLADEDGERGFGVLVPRGPATARPKPAFCALRTMAADPPPFVGCPPGPS